MPGSSPSGRFGIPALSPLWSTQPVFSTATNLTYGRRFDGSTKIPLTAHNYRIAVTINDLAPVGRGLDQGVNMSTACVAGGTSHCAASFTTNHLHPL